MVKSGKNLIFYLIKLLVLYVYICSHLHVKNMLHFYNWKTKFSFYFIKIQTQKITNWMCKIIHMVHIVCDIRLSFFVGFFRVISSKLMFSLFLGLPVRKVLDPNGPHINTIQIELKNFPLSVISKFCLTWLAFWLPTLFFFVKDRNYDLCLIKYHKYQWHLGLVTHIFTKLS